MKKNLFISIVISLLTLTLSFANTERYRLVITDDPATTITIAWDQISGGSPMVYYGTIDHGTAYQNYSNSFPVGSIVSNSYKGMNNHFAKLTGLLPDTVYYFVIHDNEGTSQRFWFRTAPNVNQPMSFIAGGDSRNNRVPRQNANKMVSKLKPTAVFFGGDMTNGDSASEWIEWMNDWQLTTATDGRMFPIVPTRGNHESSNASIYNLFNVPSTNVYYDITFGANLYTIYTLNSEIAAGGDQYTWLSGKLATDNSVWKSAQYHKPMRPHQSNKTEGNDEYTSWGQLFYDNGISLVYESDSHTVKTTYPVKPCSSGANCDEGFEVDSANGIVFVGEGCWGAPLRVSDDDKSWTRDSGSFNQFKWVTVSSDRIELKTIMVDNANTVGENSNNETPGVLPSGVQVWIPSNGDTVIITNSGNILPVVAITSHQDQEVLPNGTGITITADASDTDGSIVSVEFKVNGVSVGVDTSAPYSVTHNFGNGGSIVEAIATDNSGATSADTITLLIGTFSNTLNITASQDVEQQANNTVIDNSSDLELVYDSAYSAGDQIIGIEFSEVDIPAGATVTSAYVQFTAKTTLSDPASYLVSVESGANPSQLSTTSSNVSGRTYLTGSAWSPSGWTADNTTVAERTSDIASQIQANVDLGSWMSGNRVVIKIEATGVTLGAGTAMRRAYSIDGGNAPVLHIEYSFGGSSNISPSVSITSHADQENVLDGSNVMLTADAFDSDGTIGSVEFKVNGISIGIDTTSPYSTIHNFVNGEATVEAIATDNEGATSSDIITLFIGNISSTLQAHYLLDGDFTDSSVYNRTITNSGVTFTTDAAKGQVANFDGASYLSISQYEGELATNARSITAWIKTTASGNSIVSWGVASSSTKWTFRLESTGELRLEVGGGYTVGSTNVADGQWHHVACTFEDDGSPNVSDVKLYVDGQLETVSPNAVTINTTNGGDVKIGADHLNRYFTGQLSDVRIYSEALTAQDISAMNALPPTADFISNLTSIEEGNSVDFSDVSTGNPTSWLWSFQGGSPSSSMVQNPSVTYAVAGTYNVTLTATNDEGDDTITKIGFITVVATSNCTDLLSDDFEGGFGNWNDGGSDAVTSATNGTSNSASIKLRDNSGSDSSMYTDALNLSGVDEVTFNFSYYPVGMENNEDFMLEISTNGGSVFTTLQTWASGTDFNNNTNYTESIIVPGPFTSNTVFRLRCDASSNNDAVYIDDVLIQYCSGSSSKSTFGKMKLLSGSESKVLENKVNSLEIKLYPNPVREQLSISFRGISKSNGVWISIYNNFGQLIERRLANAEDGNVVQFHVEGLHAGIYFAIVTDAMDNIISNHRFIKK
ncbi:LamG-like jellyroll fold domain-containing protein [Snuella lapsa]|uniref:PKD domain-containing protein n=1 Tax=Snuella lapsa TaxID=870481 RepID=A0ABP6Y1K0_9FLAO